MSILGDVKTQMTHAIIRKNISKLISILEDYATKNKLYPGCSALTIACSENEVASTMLLLRDPNIAINGNPQENTTPLREACLKNHPKIVELLLADSRIDPNHRNHQGSYHHAPLSVTCFDGNVELTKLLLKHEKTNPNQIEFNDKGLPAGNPFLATLSANWPNEISANHLQIIELLFADKRFKIDNKLKLGITELILIMEVKYPDPKLQFEHVKKLIAAGADPTIKSSQERGSYTAVQRARAFGLTEIANYLDNLSLSRNKNQQDYRELRENKLNPSVDTNLVTQRMEKITLS